MNADSLAAQLGLKPGVAKPPVEKWNPPLSGDMDMIIRKDGTWWHEGELIRRDALVRLFASILKCESGEYFLVTPVEKWRVRVEDTPLHVRMTERRGDDVWVLLSDGRELALGQSADLIMRPLDGEDIPVAVLSDGLDARFLRSAYYALVDLVEFGQDEAPVIKSAGRQFELI